MSRLQASTNLLSRALCRARQGEKPPTSLPTNYIPPSHRVVYTKVQKVNWLVPAATRRAAAEEFAVNDPRGLGESGMRVRTHLCRYFLFYLDFTS